MVLFLDNQHRLIKKERLFLGTINVTNVYPREIIKESLYCNAAALILATQPPFWPSRTELFRQNDHTKKLLRLLS